MDWRHAALQATSFIVGLTLIAGVIINYMKREDVQGTWLASHFYWQMRTLWSRSPLGLAAAQRRKGDVFGTIALSKYLVANTSKLL